MSQKFHHPGGKSQSGGESSDGDAPGFGKILWDWNRGIKEASFAYQNLPWFYMTSKYVCKLDILNVFFLKKYYAVVAVCLKGTGWESHIFGGWKTQRFSSWNSQVGGSWIRLLQFRSVRGTSPSPHLGMKIIDSKVPLKGDVFIPELIRFILPLLQGSILKYRTRKNFVWSE